MKIGFDASRITVPQRTGTENYSFYLARALAKVDTRNHYVLHFRSARGGFPAIDRFGDFEHISGGNPRFEAQVIPWPFFWTQGGLAWECLKYPPDLLFVPAHTLPLIRRPSLKSVVTIHDLGFEYLPEYHQFPQKLYLDKATRFAARYATHLIAVSEATRKDLIKRFKVPEEKITVIYEGVDQKKFKNQSAPGGSKIKNEELRQKYGIRGPYILFVGTVQPRKNLRRLIEAFSMVVKEAPPIEGRPNSPEPDSLRRKESSSFPSGARLGLVIAGKPGWMFEGIYEAPRDFGIEDRVRFLGHVEDEDLPPLYRGAVCFVFPSLYEGFGLPVLEAMASGVPVIASNTSSLPEVGGKAAIYVDPYKVSSIAEGIVKVIGGGESFRRPLIEKGLKQAERFSWEKTARETLAVFEKVASMDEG